MSTENKQLPITPLPWEIVTHDHMCQITPDASLGDAALVVAMTHWYMGDPEDEARGKANAKFIVEAVNNYQNLKDACVRKDAAMFDALKCLIRCEPPRGSFEEDIRQQRKSTIGNLERELQTSRDSALSPSLDWQEEAVALRREVVDANKARLAMEEQLRKLRGAFASSCSSRELELEKALQALLKTSNKVNGKVEFSMEHSRRACAHQEFLMEDDEDKAAWELAKKNARALLESTKAEVEK